MVNIFENLDDQFLDEVKKVITKWQLSKENKQEFLALRKYYNDNLSSLSQRENAVILSGAGRSYFSPQLEEKLKKYIEVKNKSDILFMSNDFVDVDISSLAKPENTFIYVDPPYLITTGAYERDYFCKWSEEYEKKLLQYLDDLNDKGYKWALSNVLEHKGKSNDILKQWSEKYTIHYLNMDYKNCNYQTKDKSANSSIEVLITNY